MVWRMVVMVLVEERKEEKEKLHQIKQKLILVSPLSFQLRVKRRDLTT